MTDLDKTNWFRNYTEGVFKNVVKGPAPDGSNYACPCCGNLTLPERGGFDICPVCFWEDDGQDNQDADVVRGGPNYALSLAAARENYSTIGACEERCVPHVRAPNPEELP